MSNSFNQIFLGNRPDEDEEPLPPPPPAPSQDIIENPKDYS